MHAVESAAPRRTRCCCRNTSRSVINVRTILRRESGADGKGVKYVAGMIVPLFTKREFDFSNGTATVVVVKSVDASRYTEGVLNVRVHSNSSTSGTGTISGHAKSIALTAEDPALDFIDGATLATASMTSSTAAGTLLRGSLGAGFGGALQITIVGNKGTSVTLRATLSAELVLKE